MGIVNRRNALLGWAVVKLGKRAAKKKAKDVVPTRETGTRSAALAAGVAAFFGVLAFWRRRAGGSDSGD
jgi:hypothetical protein